MSILPPVLPLLIAIVAFLLLGSIGVLASRSADPMQHVRGRLWLALGTFGAVLVASWVWGTERPSLLGLPVVVGPGAAAAAGVLVFAALP
ncbi:hypothetical protein, partial [uncultured Amnibacterium sp.]|uniref:hypothetical protein n=1 Tax=uncultured Amnibacterium sp. TaxID=1631851 RepID=UPI0035CC94C5